MDSHSINEALHVATAPVNLKLDLIKIIAGGGSASQKFRGRDSPDIPGIWLATENNDAESQCSLPGFTTKQAMKERARAIAKRKIAINQEVLHSQR